ncbi:hypothetical protein P152DRAFT_59680, partial [Eremomyces bilateralis CBS 781.70]
MNGIAFKPWPQFQSSPPSSTLLTTTTDDASQTSPTSTSTPLSAIETGPSKHLPSIGPDSSPNPNPHTKPDTIPTRILVSGIMGPLVLLFLIALGIYLCIVRRRQKRRHELEAADPPMHLQPNATSLTRSDGTAAPSNPPPSSPVPTSPPPVLLTRDITAAYYTGIDTSDHPRTPPPPISPLENPFEPISPLDDDEPPPPYRPRSENGSGADGLGNPFEDPEELGEGGNGMHVVANG